ncbi:MAG TPA: hypothetical protein VMT70_06580 [Vicinamibacteria bacterium]|nr:hypothetical protein [Vicinamibacteria bacterium]
MRGRAALGCVLGIGSSFVLACGSSGSQTISLGNADAGRSVVASVGDKVEVTLQTIGPGQYGDPVVSSGSVMFLGVSEAGPPIPAGATQLYRFEAVAPGPAGIAIPHTGDLPAGPATPAFTITVVVS